MGHMGHIAFHLDKLLKKSKEKYLIDESMSRFMQFSKWEVALRCWEYKYLHIISGATEIRMMVTRQIPSASLYISTFLTHVRKQILILQKKHLIKLVFLA